MYNDNTFKTNAKRVLLSLDNVTHSFITVYEDEIARLNQLLQDQARQNGKLVECNNTQATTIRQLQDATVWSKVNMLSDAKTRLEYQLKTVMEHRNAAEQEVLQLKTALNKKNDHFISMHRHIDELDGKLHELRQETSSLKNVVSDLEDELEDRYAYCDQLEDIIEQQRTIDIVIHLD